MIGHMLLAKPHPLPQPTVTALASSYSRLVTLHDIIQVLPLSPVGYNVSQISKPRIRTWHSPVCMIGEVKLGKWIPTFAFVYYYGHDPLANLGTLLSCKSVAQATSSHPSSSSRPSLKAQAQALARARFSNGFNISIGCVFFGNLTTTVFQQALFVQKVLQATSIAKRRLASHYQKHCHRSNA